LMGTGTTIGKMTSVQPSTIAMPTPTLALASKSPRRRQLLTEAGLAHEIIPSGIDDGQLSASAVHPAHWVTALAYMKAAAGAGQWAAAIPDRPAVVLGADTVCVKDTPVGQHTQHEIIGQPDDADHARAIITRLNNGAHSVITGVALIDTHAGQSDLFSAAAHVRVGDIGREAIDRYIDSGNWQGKAGAYNLFERLDAGWPIEFEGDPHTIVGLPIADLLPRLARLGITPAG
ncbi:MAG: Maf family protein, partial [Planctomycetota bacterium]